MKRCEDDSNSTRTLDIYLPYVCKVSICRLVWVAIVLSTAKAMREPVTRIKQIVIENLQEMEDEGEIYESIEDIWPDYPSKEDFFFNEEEY